MSLTKEYIEKRDDVFWVAGTRVSLDSVVYAFRRGASPESIERSFPLLTLEQVYGAITFYLARQPEIDTYLRHGDEELERTREARVRRILISTTNWKQPGISCPRSRFEDSVSS